MTGGAERVLLHLQAHSSTAAHRAPPMAALSSPSPPRDAPIGAIVQGTRARARLLLPQTRELPTTIAVQPFQHTPTRSDIQGESAPCCSLGVPRECRQLQRRSYPGARLGASAAAPTKSKNKTNKARCGQVPARPKLIPAQHGQRAALATVSERPPAGEQPPRQLALRADSLAGPRRRLAHADGLAATLRAVRGGRASRMRPRCACTAGGRPAPPATDPYAANLTRKRIL